MNTLFETPSANLAGVSKFNAHDRTTGKDEWLTPREITDALGPFDIDPCAPIVRPHDIATVCLTIEDDGLKTPWSIPGGAPAFVFCNPPYGTETKRWYRKMSEHGHGIMLTFARTETEMFFDSVWGRAQGIFFIKKRVTFIERNCALCGRGQSIHNPTFEAAEHTYAKGGGFVKGEASAGAPSVLIAYGAQALTRLMDASLTGRIKGYFVEL